jgi:hypothetical protein
MIAVLAAMLFMIKAIDGPFGGEVSVQPDALELFLSSVRQ